jgi:hypothetical protein
MLQTIAERCNCRSPKHSPFPLPFCACWLVQPAHTTLLLQQHLQHTPASVADQAPWAAAAAAAQILLNSSQKHSAHNMLPHGWLSTHGAALATSCRRRVWLPTTAMAPAPQLPHAQACACLTHCGRGCSRGLPRGLREGPCGATCAVVSALMSTMGL